MGFVKDAAMWSISRGLRLPQPQLDRMAELFFLRNLLQQLQVQCVLDVGANRGQFASELRSIGYDGHIVSFEPLASEFAVMQQHFASDAKWRGYQTALGSEESTVDINVGGLTVMTSLLESVLPDRNARLETVTVKRLDGLLPGILAEVGCERVFLKMDTQGYDLEVFKGLTGSIAAILGIQSELSVVPLYKNMPHYLEALQCYEAAGFELFNLSVVNRVTDGGLLEMNCFMRRAEFGGLTPA